MTILLGVSVKMHKFPYFAWKSARKLAPHVRVDFSEGCKSVVFSKVLGRVFPPWAGFLPDYQILAKMGGISP